MINALSVANYRSLKDLVTPLAQLNVVTGANGSGKSNLYKALRLLSETVQGGVIASLASEGGIQSCLWAGPSTFSKAEQAGRKVQGKHHNQQPRLKLGFAGNAFSYAIELGLPPALSTSLFNLDPEIKREVIWSGPFYRPANCLVDRDGAVIKVRDGRSWQAYQQNLSPFECMLSEVADPERTPEIFTIRQCIKQWRFYDQFRTDADSTIRAPQIGTRTPVLSHDGYDLVAALRTIYEIGDRQALADAIDDAFPGASLNYIADSDARFTLEFQQPGLLRGLSQAELSDGTLRYLLLCAALLTPRPPSLLVLNEPETSLHPDLLPALARLIVKASKQTQVWVVSHAARLVAALEAQPDCHSIVLGKNLGATQVMGQGMLDEPAWYWPS